MHPSFRIGALAFLTLQLLHPSAAQAVQRQPNIVYILLDDLDERVSGPYLKDVMPFTMGLAQQGVTFVNNYSAVICCEARAGILSGLYPHNNGVFTNGGAYGGRNAFTAPIDRNGLPIKDPVTGLPIDNENYTIAKRLHDAGYRTGIIGKYLNGYQIDRDTGVAPTPPPGWSEGAVFVDKMNSYTGYNYIVQNWREGASPMTKKYGHTAADYNTDVLRGFATDFIERAASNADDKPFFLYLAPTAPHLPLPPAPRHLAVAAQWLGTLPTDRPNYFKDNIEQKPFWLRESWDKRNSRRMRIWTEADWHRRLGSLYAVDEMVKSLWEQLERLGKLDDTVVVIHSDNGYNLGAHALIHKMAPYEESVRVPLMIVGGKNLGFRTNAREERISLHIDLAPTFAELGNTLPTPYVADGLSLLPLLVNEGPRLENWRANFLEEYKGGSVGSGITDELPPMVKTLATFLAAPAFTLDIPTHAALHGEVAGKRFVFIDWYEENALIRDRELYDLARDPYQLTNLLATNRAGCTGLLPDLKARLEEMKACRSTTCNGPWDKAEDPGFLARWRACYEAGPSR